MEQTVRNISHNVEMLELHFLFRSENFRQALLLAAQPFPRQAATVSSEIRVGILCNMIKINAYSVKIY